MAGLEGLYTALAETCDGPLAIEAVARAALLQAAPLAQFSGDAAALPDGLLAELDAPDAHPCCNLIAHTALPWAPPPTSSDPAYVALARYKHHVSLIGPEGLVHSDRIRLGLYGLVPDADYGIRTHPAEEVFIMLAGRAFWKRGTGDYAESRPGDRSHHPSMMPHATRTECHGFLSLYVWTGDISTEQYRYHGS
ncbi:MAG: dimethylsulfonioproprionate lyase family protein [Silicimonas sp.]|nr:dimethylsulfonioproprionate lyase family protein [Silicimonas sp.]